MAKEKVKKQWVMLIVGATWLLTTLSACVGKVDQLRLDLSNRLVSEPRSILDAEVIYVDGQSCPDELWGRWEDIRSHSGNIMTFSQTTDKSGVQEITQKEKEGFPFYTRREKTYIVDGKLHNGKFPTGIKYTYAASCNFKLKDFNYKVFRVVKNRRSAEGAWVDDYIVGGKLKGVSILVHGSYFTRNRHLDLENSMSVATGYLKGLYGKDSQ